MTEAALLARRLERYRDTVRALGPTGPALDPAPVVDRAALARALAAAIAGTVQASSRGSVVWRWGEPLLLPLDRGRLAELPGQPPPDAPLVCLDTETTGLATAAGTVAFLVGLGWWEGAWFRRVQLLLPDHADEPALLEAIAGHIPDDAWLVTYNGRGFDWPLLVTRFRLARQAAPAHAGHLDLLPVVRRVFRHRMFDARLRTVETDLLGLARHEDVDGWEIPGRYLDFLRTGQPEPLVAVIRHNDEDVASLARLLVHLDRTLADPQARPAAPRGDLAGLARAYWRDGRLADALGCLDLAAAAPPSPPVVRAVVETGPGSAPRPHEPWWSPRRTADFGGPPRRPVMAAETRVQAFDRPWDEGRLLADRARLLRRLGRIDEALEAWDGLAAGPGRLAVIAGIEAAKIREHIVRDTSGALASAAHALALAERRRRLGLPEPALETSLRGRIRRLSRRLERRSRRPA
jgi:RNase_H superfamily